MKMNDLHYCASIFNGLGAAATSANRKNPNKWKQQKYGEWRRRLTIVIINVYSIQFSERAQKEENEQKKN